jgi:chemotaxis signal transduction protein
MNQDEKSGREPHLKKPVTASSFADSGSRWSDGGSTRRVQLVHAGLLRLAIFEDEIATIAEWRQPTPLPRATPAVLGIVSIQGRMLTVLDPVVLLGQAESMDGPRSFIGGFIVALRGDEQLALAVENKAETLEVTAEDIQPPPETATRTVFGIVHHADQIVSVLNLKKLFPAAIRGRERRRRRF